MKDLNDILPKIPNMKWGALTNMPPTNSTIKELNKLLPNDGRWHSILGSKDSVDVDGITIRKHTKDRWT